MVDFVQGYEDSILGCPELRKEYEQLLSVSAGST